MVGHHVFLSATLNPTSPSFSKATSGAGYALSYVLHYTSIGALRKRLNLRVYSATMYLYCVYNIGNLLMSSVQRPTFNSSSRLRG